MNGHWPHRVRGTRGCNGSDVILRNGDSIPCADAYPRPFDPAQPVVLDPWQDPQYWPAAPAANCPMYHGDACEGVHN